MDLERALSDIIANLSISESSWEFVTSAGVEVSAGTKIVHLAVNGTTGSLWVRQKGANKVRLNYGGVGGSVGLSMIPSPLNLSFSITDMPSFGKIYKLPFAGKALSLNELKGGLVIYQLSYDMSIGASVGLMFLGGRLDAAVTGPFFVPMLVATSNACVRFLATSISAVPLNTSAAAYVGMVY